MLWYTDTESLFFVVLWTLATLNLSQWFQQWPPLVEIKENYMSSAVLGHRPA